MDFSSVMPEDKSFRAASAEVSMGMGTCFGSEITSFFVQIREKRRHSRTSHPSWLILPVVTCECTGGLAQGILENKSSDF